MNYNLATSTNFKLEIGDDAGVDYFIQSVDFPGISLPEVISPYRDHQVFIPGDTIQYDPLSVQMLVNEDYSNYIYLVKWLRLCRTHGDTQPYRDITLYTLNNNKVGDISIRFRYAFPTMIGPMNFNSSTPSNEPFSCAITFRYQEFEFYNKNEELTMME